MEAAGPFLDSLTKPTLITLSIIPFSQSATSNMAAGWGDGAGGRTDTFARRIYFGDCACATKSGRTFTKQFLPRVLSDLLALPVSRLGRVESQLYPQRIDKVCMRLAVLDSGSPPDSQ